MQEQTVLMSQVHGNNVVVVSKKDVGKVIPDCDALITNDPSVTLSVRVADCLPISVIDKKNHVFGIIHAGWRGLDNKIIKKTIWKMNNEFGSVSSDLTTKIGPHICAKHYEVKSDVSSKFDEYPKAILKNNNKLFLDLAKVAELQLMTLGVKKENIEVDSGCTFEDKKLYSYRRDKTDKRNLITLNI